MTLKELEARVQTIEDIEAIKKLQRAYGYYLEHWEGPQILDLFSDSPNVSVETGTRVYAGQEGIKEFALKGEKPPEFLHGLMQLSGIVDVDPGGKTAKGRWYGFGCLATPTEGVYTAKWTFGAYENVYVKENGNWKIKKLHWNRIFTTPYEDGWVKTPTTLIRISRFDGPQAETSTINKGYPSGYIFPYHYKNPVSGK